MTRKNATTNKSGLTTKSRKEPVQLKREALEGVCGGIDVVRSAIQVWNKWCMMNDSDYQLQKTREAMQENWYTN